MLMLLVQEAHLRATAMGNGTFSLKEGNREERELG